MKKIIFICIFLLGLIASAQDKDRQWTKINDYISIEKVQ